MIRIAVISGKGGTGKTVVTAALAHLIPFSRVLADCDVDAANLALILSPTETTSRPFYGMEKAVIDPELCTGCGICAESCRFGAIREKEGVFSADPVRCEGCGLCEAICPASAIHLGAFCDGEIFYSQTAEGPLSHAELRPGSGNSGLLVHQVKQQALEKAGDREILLIDGPPGIGCPVISTISGLDAVIVVTEPSVSATHDLARLIKVTRGFDLVRYCIINRFDLDPGMTGRIDQFCEDEEITLLGRIPFDPAVLASVREGKIITEYDCPAREAVEKIWKALARELGVAP